MANNELHPDEVISGLTQATNVVLRYEDDIGYHDNKHTDGSPDKKKKMKSKKHKKNKMDDRVRDPMEAEYFRELSAVRMPGLDDAVPEPASYQVYQQQEETSFTHYQRMWEVKEGGEWCIGANHHGGGQRPEFKNRPSVTRQTSVPVADMSGLRKRTTVSLMSMTSLGTETDGAFSVESRDGSKPHSSPEHVPLTRLQPDEYHRPKEKVLIRLKKGPIKLYEDDIQPVTAGKETSEFVSRTGTENNDTDFGRTESQINTIEPVSMTNTTKERQNGSESQKHKTDSKRNQIQTKTEREMSLSGEFPIQAPPTEIPTRPKQQEHKAVDESPMPVLLSAQPSQPPLATAIVKPKQPKPQPKLTGGKTESTPQSAPKVKQSSKPAKQSAAASVKVEPTTAAVAAENSGTATTADGEAGEEAYKLCGLTCQSNTRRGRMFKRFRAGGPFPAIWNFIKMASTKMVDTLKAHPLLILVIVAVLLLLLFLILFPISLVYVHYHEVALKRTLSTGKIQRDTVYYPGCYVLGPDTEFVMYQKSAHIVELDNLSVFTYDRLELDVDVSYSYFIRPEEVGDLDGLYGPGYDDIFRRIAVATLKNTFISYSLNQLLRNRDLVQNGLHTALFQKFAGTCCMKCCVQEVPCMSAGSNSTLCSGCDASATCDPGLHIEVRLFQLGVVHIPAEIEEKIMSVVLSQLAAETAAFQQQIVVTEAETNRQVQAIMNSANEVREVAIATSNQLTTLAYIEHEAITQNSTTAGWRNMSQALSITQEDHLNSLFYINTLANMNNLILVHNFNHSANIDL